jgi:RNA polymerase sigma factor (sigma-70 family)
LVRECLAGSEQAWNEFYAQFVGLVRSIVVRRLGSVTNDVENYVQEVFSTLISALESYDPTYTLDQFVATIATRESIGHYRSLTRTKRFAQTDPVEHHDSREEGLIPIVSAGPSSEDRMAEEELVRLMREGMQSLDKSCRQLLGYKYFEDMTYQQMSDILGATPGSLAVKVSRCMSRLRDLCEELLKKGIRS